MNAHTDPPAARTGAVDDDEQLPCGRLLSRVWDDWERRPADPHPRTCPFCREAVRGLDDLESAVRGLRDETSGTPDTSAYDATTLTERVMDVVRLELRPGPPLPLGEPGEDLWIMEAVAARTLRAAAETVSGVRAGSCRVVPRPASGTVGGAVEIRLDVHAESGVSLPELADRVRDRVREAADHRLGMDVAAVDIRVTDLIDTGGGSPTDGRTHGTTDSQEGRAR